MIGRTISHYKIIEKLGGGGMGVVYKAQDTKLDRIVALKFLPNHMLADEESEKRFISEAKAASSFNHNNICTIYEIDKTDDDQLFIAMACYEGETLKKKLEDGPIKIEEALDITSQVAEGLSKAHKKGIVHRDMKPANIFITKEGIVKILDFGLAKVTGRTQLTQMGSTVGTVAYMSPEQTRGENVDQRSDIWSTGVVLYEMITGRQPFKGDYEQAIIYSILNDNPDAITGLRSGVPMELERITNKLLAKNIKERYQSVTDLLVDLQALRMKSTLEETSSITKEITNRKRKLPVKWVLASAVLVLVILYLILFFPWESSTHQIRSLAVLPLDNLSHNPEQEYFVDGMTEALITELSKISSLKVISRTSVMQFKYTKKTIPEIASLLGVDAIIEGSALQVEDNVRITAQLFDATDKDLWGDQFTKKLENILELQSDVAQAIANEVQVVLTPREQTALRSNKLVNPEAYKLYLQGRFHWSQRTVPAIHKSIQLYERAISLEPNFAVAYAELANAYALLPFYERVDPFEAFGKAKIAALKALDMDKDLAEAHAAIGFVYFYFEWDWVAAEKEYKLAVNLNPNYVTGHHWYAEYLSSMGRHKEAIMEIKSALQIDPLSLLVNTMVGYIYYYAREYDLALEHIRKALALDPNYSLAHSWLGHIYARQGMYTEAQTEYKIYSGKPRALVYALMGKRKEAIQLLNLHEKYNWKNYYSAFYIACVYLALGEKDRTLDWLMKAYEARAIGLSKLKVSPNLDKLHNEPRYQDLLRKMNFPMNDSNGL